MKVLGVIPSTDDVVWSLVERQGGVSVVPLDTDRQVLNKQKTDEVLLVELKNSFTEHLKNIKPDKVVILRAGASKHGNQSTKRAKFEGIIQLVCAECEIPVQAVGMQMKARLKKYEIENGLLEDAVNNKVKFSSIPRKEAAFLAKVNL